MSADCGRSERRRRRRVGFRAEDEESVAESLQFHKCIEANLIKYTMNHFKPVMLLN